MEGRPTVMGEESAGDRRVGLLLITDVGSTTTKGLLLSREDGGLSFRAMADSPTTVEQPEEDVCRGVSRVVRELEERTGLRISRGGMPAVPYLTSSSAGGGLQILALGLTSTETGRIAFETACNAGGVVIGTVTIDDGLLAAEKVRLMRRTNPDMILLAGGTDGGAIAGVVRLAELLKLADPALKYRRGERAVMPVVYCGNRDAADYVMDILGERFMLSIVPNVRPSMEETNLEPAEREIHRLFMDNVMERAPGYSGLLGYTVSDVLPTPAAVQRILELYAGRLSGGMVMMDMGGATTDIFSRLDGRTSRTVSANTGMSYSMSNVLADAGMSAVIRHLPSSLPEGDVRDYICNKTLSPTSVPSTDSEQLVEHAVAAEGAALAWLDHLDGRYSSSRVGALDREKSLSTDRFRRTFERREPRKTPLPRIDLLIGAGGVMSHAGPLEALRILAEGFRPRGITRVCIDRHFRSPHMGLLSEADPDEALRLFDENCLEDVGWVVAPLGEEEGMTVTRTSDGSEVEVPGTGALLLREGADLQVRLEEGGTSRVRTDLPVLLDRRPADASSGSLALSVPEWAPGDGADPGGLRSMAPADSWSATEGEWEQELRLPYEGEILVSEGDAVAPGDVVGLNRYDPPRVYVIDLNRIAGYDRHLTAEEVREGLLVSEGDTVQLRQKLFQVHRSGLTGFDFTYRSTVRGRVTAVEESGLVIVREIQDYDDRPHVVDVAGPLDVRPSRIRGYLQFSLDDFVGAGQSIARDVSKGVFVKSPATGLVRDIDTGEGTVTIRYDVTPREMTSNVRGVVGRVEPGFSATVTGRGLELRGVVGFGGRRGGPLRLHGSSGEEPEKGGMAVFTVPIGLGTLEAAAEAGAAGVVAPSIPSSDLVAFLGREMGMAVTGSEEIPFTLMLTGGFGRAEMDAGLAARLAPLEGLPAGLDGRTRVRAGVIRPRMLISEG